jgi:hypothetical protein
MAFDLGRMYTDIGYGVARSDDFFTKLERRGNADRFDGSVDAEAAGYHKDCLPVCRPPQRFQRALSARTDGRDAGHTGRQIGLTERLGEAR